MGKTAQRERPEGDWLTPRGQDALLEELELCGVPLDASVWEARCRLELSGVWVTDCRLGGALRYRWRAAGRTGPVPASPALAA
ncbi:hypothetical protein ACIODS_09010 [Micromonospora chalcea]|uniref:hypothetical protein n=1 Tax=Micromonospora chalcea TaxID=1874 RepID=UPI00381258D5